MVAENNTPPVFSILVPYAGPKRAWRTYKSLFLGISFDLFVGKAIPDEHRDMCFVRGEGNPIYMSDMLGERIAVEMRMSIKRSRNFVKK